MAWKIDRDYLDGDDSDGTCAIGVTCGELVGETFRFRVRDDDDIVYYGGAFDAAAAEDDEEPEGLYDALGWAMTYAGATDLQVKVRDGIRFALTDRKFCDERNLGEDDWVSIYG